MNGIKFLMALVAACILIIPAFSMPDHGMGLDCKQKSCDCQQNMMGQDNKEKMWQGQDDKQKKMCDDMKPRMEQDGKQMWQGHDEDHIKSMMGPECDQIGHKHIKSMMGDREKGDNGGIKVVIVNLRV